MSDLRDVFRRAAPPPNNDAVRFPEINMPVYDDWRGRPADEAKRKRQQGEPAGPPVRVPTLHLPYGPEDR